jgi:hypothetical protein
MLADTRRPATGDLPADLVTRAVTCRTDLASLAIAAVARA